MQNPNISRAVAAPLGDDPSRRRFLAAGSAVTVFASLRSAIAHAEAQGGESELFRLMRELEKAHVEGFSLDDEAYEANYELHWNLRERIDAIPARSTKELKVKARAAEFALARDPDHECGGLGSFVGISRSIIRDLMALTA
jgi:hypothetical protein